LTVSRVEYPTQHITSNVGDESFEAISCTGIDNQTNDKHLPKKTKKACKTLGQNPMPQSKPK